MPTAYEIALATTVRKTDQVIQHMRDGEFRAALKIASTFRLGLTDQQMVDLKRGHQAHHHPDFFKSIGKDPTELIAQGKAVLQQLYGARL